MGRANQKIGPIISSLIPTIYLAKQKIKHRVHIRHLNSTQRISRETTKSVSGNILTATSTERKQQGHLSLRIGYYFSPSYLPIARTSHATWIQSCYKKRQFEDRPVNRGQQVACRVWFMDSVLGGSTR
ncbi:hypothetical protein CDAR_454601 [Caerostris darwini]|uniref:Uncharacterized protein n=1 Tax=Caerostris darwini TaxID=1538125 RepID=A0AAV4TWC0_9ARAC|nr:hypothetical protein CDAR_454601 [Caerostris darwini]